MTTQEQANFYIDLSIILMSEKDIHVIDAEVTNLFAYVDIRYFGHEVYNHIRTNGSKGLYKLGEKYEEEAYLVVS